MMTDTHPTLSDIPLEIIQVIKRIRNIEPSAIVAGGCLRDSVRGIPYKDIDVFFQCTLETYCTQLDNILQATQDKHDRRPDWADIRTQHEIYEAWSGDIVGVEEYTSHGHEINLIAMSHGSDMKTICNRIDTGLNQIATDGHEIYYTKLYTHDSKHKRFTAQPFKLPYFNLQHTQDRVARFQAKYPGWPLVIDERLDNAG